MEDKIRKFLEQYRVGYFVYPGVVSRNCKVDIKSTYKILNKLCDENILEEICEIHCPNCGKTLKKITTIRQLLDYFYCDFCNKSISPILSDAYIFYKVKKKIR